jgi:FMN phosphatase YigB (HAD superfamily)
MIKGIIFDLDDTLFDCTGQLTAPARLRAAEILASTSDATTYYQQQETLSQIHGSSEAIRKLGSQNNIPSDIVEKALAAYNSDEVEAITPFPDVSETLSKLAQRNYKLVLVTSGHPERQKKKVHLLGLQNYFNETDNTLFLHDDRKNADKGPHLQMAAEHLSLPYPEIIAVGDKLTAEITAGNVLGMTTVRMRHGRQKDRIPQTDTEYPDYEIDCISELLSLLP